MTVKDFRDRVLEILLNDASHREETSKMHAINAYQWDVAVAIRQLAEEIEAINIDPPNETR